MEERLFKGELFSSDPFHKRIVCCRLLNGTRHFGGLSNLHTVIMSTALPCTFGDVPLEMQRRENSNNISEVISWWRPGETVKLQPCKPFLFSYKLLYIRCRIYSANISLWLLNVYFKFPDSIHLISESAVSRTKRPADIVSCFHIIIFLKEYSSVYI